MWGHAALSSELQWGFSGCIFWGTWRRLGRGEGSRVVLRGGERLRRRSHWGQEVRNLSML